MDFLELNSWLWTMHSLQLENRHRVIAENPHIALPDVTRHLAAEWAVLDPAKKKVWKACQYLCCLLVSRACDHGDEGADFHSINTCLSYLIRSTLTRLILRKSSSSVRTQTSNILRSGSVWDVLHLHLFHPSFLLFFILHCFRWDRVEIFTSMRICVLNCFYKWHCILRLSPLCLYHVVTCRWWRCGQCIWCKETSSRWFFIIIIIASYS